MRARRLAALTAVATVLAGCGGTPGPARAERAPGGSTGATAPSQGPGGARSEGVGAETTGHRPARRIPGPARPWTISPIRGRLRDALVPRNWRPGCPVPLSDLRWLTVAYRGFDGERKIGPLVVHEGVAEDVRWVFRRLYRAGFPIRRVALPRRYRPDVPRRETWDDTHDVTAAFNCRPVTDGTAWSQHAFGLAIDINPLQNPYVRGDGSVLRRVARPYRDRGLEHPGMIREGDVVVRSFDAIGWGWGGRWHTLKDYMHFSATGD